MPARLNIESWINTLVDDDCENYDRGLIQPLPPLFTSLLFPDMEDIGVEMDMDMDMEDMQTPTRKPNKRVRKAHPAGVAAADPDETPRPALVPLLGGSTISDAVPTTADNPSPSHSGYCNSSSAEHLSTAGSSVRSGRSSPRKRELRLRNTAEFPVERRVQLWDDLSRLAGGDGSGLNGLLDDLYSIATGGEGLVPDIFEASLASVRPRPPRYCFLPVTEAAASDAALRARLEREHFQLERIVRNSRTCAQRLAHEAEWNDRVHAQLLQEALDGWSPVVDFRNITAVRTAADFLDPDPVIRENKIDYGLFLYLEEPDLAYIRGRHPGGLALNHTNLGDDVPLAVSIETKSLLADAVGGHTQLANWARAQFRHLDRAVKVRTAAAERSQAQDDETARHSGESVDEREERDYSNNSSSINNNNTRRSTVHNSNVVAAPTRPAPDPIDNQIPLSAPALPILPLVFVYGNIWSVQFALRAEGKTVRLLCIPRCLPVRY